MRNFWPEQARCNNRYSKFQVYIMKILKKKCASGCENRITFSSKEEITNVSKDQHSNCLAFSSDMTPSFSLYLHWKPKSKLKQENTANNRFILLVI